MQPKTRQRFTLFLIIAAFAVPMIAAYMTYITYQDGGFRTTNRGTFVEPAVDTKQLDVTMRDGHVKTIAELNDVGELRGRWILVYVAPTKCDDSCLQIAYYINQLYLAMGKNQQYLLPMVLQPQNSPAPTPLQSEVSYVTATKTELANIIDQIPAAHQPGAAGAIYLIDSHGFLMMVYTTDENPDNILKDLQHLIRS